MIVRKRSVQREVILKILNNTKSHPSADWIYQEARKQIPNISLGTVYRNLALLVRSGCALKLDIGGDSDHFDGDVSPHYHFVCEKCGKITDLDAPYNADLDLWAQQNECGEIKRHSLCFHGICNACAGHADARAERKENN